MPTLDVHLHSLFKNQYRRLPGFSLVFEKIFEICPYEMERWAMDTLDFKGTLSKRRVLAPRHCVLKPPQVQNRGLESSRFGNVASLALYKLLVFVGNSWWRAG